MSELHPATIIADADLADDVEFPVRLAGTPGLLRGTFAKLKTYLLASLATRFIPAGGTTGQVLTKNSVTDYDIGWGAGGGGGGGSTNLDGLTDVDTTTVAPVDGDLLRFDFASGLWKPHAPTGLAASSLVKLDQVVVAVAGDTINFASIPGTYEDLIVVINGQLSGAADFVWGSLNGDTTAAHYQYVRGDFQNGSVTYTSGTAIGLDVGLLGGATAGASYADVLEVTLYSYARTTFFKKAMARSTLRFGTAANQVTDEVQASDWLSTAAVNAIALKANSGNFTVGTVATLYGRG